MRIHRERTPSVLLKRVQDSKNRGEEEEKKSLREQRRKEAKTQKKSGKPLRSKNKSIAKSRHSAAVFLVLLATFCCSLRRGCGLFKLASCSVPYSRNLGLGLSLERSHATRESNQAFLFRRKSVKAMVEDFTVERRAPLEGS